MSKPESVAPGTVQPAGLVFKPKFATDEDQVGVTPRGSAERTAVILDHHGAVVFRQEGIKAPEDWSQTAINIVASKYFYGDAQNGKDPCKGGREHSVYGMVARVVNTITAWGSEDRYFHDLDSEQAFAADLTYLLLHQYAAFNSPVWFNTGLYQSYGVQGRPSGYRFNPEEDRVEECQDSYRNPQISACFIQSVEDNMDSIMNLAKSEAMLFKYGSGTGTDLSTLRSSREKIQGGGRASGPVSFMRIYDATASVIKSGGKTRRAAKMQTLKCHHPDIREFIRCKAEEDRKAKALIESGVCSAGMTGATNEAYSSVAFQNANLSVRLTDAFLRAAVSDNPMDRQWTTRAVLDGRVVDRLDASDLLDEIALAAHQCGDPGVQYEDTIQAWHTCPNDARINSSNPCCFVGETLVQTSEGLVRFDDLHESFNRGRVLPRVFAFDTQTGMPCLRRIKRVWIAGQAKKLMEVRTQRGHVFHCTPEHRFLTYDGRYVEAQNLRSGMRLRKIGIGVNEQRSGRRSINHKTTPDCPSGTEYLSRWIWEQINGPIPDGHEVHHKNGNAKDDRLSNYELIEETSHDRLHSVGEANARYIDVTETLLLETWEAIEADPRKTHKDAGPAVTVARWNAYVRRHNLNGKVPLARGDGRIRGMSWDAFAAWIDSRKVAANDRVEAVRPFTPIRPTYVYDMEVEGTHNFAVGSEASRSSVIVHNSEYMFIDDTACNLASLNLLQFLEPGGRFDTERFRAAVRIMIVAQDILVSHANYPTASIAYGSHLYRTLGLGYANLGSMLQACGLPYDSVPGRELAAAVTALMQGMAYATSAELAATLGQFPRYANNAEPMLEVVKNHRTCAVHQGESGYAATKYQYLWTAAQSALGVALERGRQYGYRNAQVTVLAPTGTIAFMMDCDTTGIEPEIALVKYKSLAGGGVLKLVNQNIPAALDVLGYDAPSIDAIVRYVEEHDTIEGAPGLDPDHLAVFDCAFPPPQGGRSLHWAAHLEMMAAVQPFISGAISKTVNMPADATVEDIRSAYLRGWRLGLKAVAIYRDGSKGVQPLTTKKVTEDAPSQQPAPRPGRERMPSTRSSLTHKFQIDGHEGYLTVGMYEDGRPGELFIKMAKEGSTIGGLMDALATSVSLGLQYGVPLDVFVRKFQHARYEPFGFTGNDLVPIASSITDYVFRWIGHTFIKGYLAPANPPVTDTSIPVPTDARPIVLADTRSSEDTKFCPDCGGLARRSGTCHTCVVCGTSLGCS